MAIQKINLGTEPLGEGGDTYRSANTKINENFSNPDHGASRMVVSSDGGLVDWKTGFQGQATVGGTGWGGASLEIVGRTTDEDIFPYLSNKGSCIFRTVADTERLYDKGPSLYIKSQATHATISIDYRTGNVKVATGAEVAGSLPPQVSTLYSDKNTKKDRNTNLILASRDTIPNNSAASRLVGKEEGQLAQWSKTYGIDSTGIGGDASFIADVNKVKRLGIGTGFYQIQSPTDVPIVRGHKWLVNYVKQSSDTASVNISTTTPNQNRIFFAHCSGGEWTNWIEYYTTANTDKHGTNGYLKPSSPILKIEQDHMWANSDGEAMGAIYTKIGVGDYEISNTTGLRSEGWYIEIPNDLHGNPHVAVTIEDVEGTIRLKCFKRVFNMNTFKFEPDLESPLDIPEGRWIDLRFNDLPVEELYEPEPDEEPTVDVEEDPEVEEEPTEEPSEESE